ncbi:MAG TPA: hypothetical protein VKR83_17710 [Ktedonobacteraceae bacterium]|nr:hypothetical protein [Ktedonobacteraceae bacterium]
MSQEQNNGIPPARQGKPATYRRANRNGRKRPVLVTGEATDQASAAQEQEDAMNRVPTQTSTPTVTEETPIVKNRPGFFSTIGIGKKEETTDAAAARLARATRNKAVVSGKKEVKEVKETKKPEPKAVTRSAPARSAAAPPRRSGGFKPRHLIGILAYLVVADVVGVYEKGWLVNAHVEKLLFSLGPLPIFTSTVLFLFTLVVLLIVLARFDLVPRSLSPSPRQPAGANRGQSQRNSDTDTGAARNTPSVKQGVKGADDDLYQEYRETRRYWQRRDRKK